MKFQKYQPAQALIPYIRYFVISESLAETEYKVLPTMGLVAGFQYKGELSKIIGDEEIKLNSSGITGISKAVKLFRNAKNTGTVLVYFSEIGFAQFSSHPACELYNLSISMDNIFHKNRVTELESKLVSAKNDHERIKLVEHFFLAHLKCMQEDKLVLEAIRLIYTTKGTIRIKELGERLFISKSPLEKRFRNLVGTTPKKFASLVRFNSVLGMLKVSKSLTDLSFENDFFDQSHFTREFKQFTGISPDKFRRVL